MDRPFFSIVIASYNDKKNLRFCLSSIGEQKFYDYEILISDGGSTDGTLEYLSSGEIANLAWFKSEADLGIYDALNMAFRQAQGEWLLVLGADDRLLDRHALSRAADLIIQFRKPPAIAYGDLFISSGGRGTFKTYPDFNVFKDKYWGGGFIHHQSAFVNAQFLTSASPFSLTYKIHADYDLMIRLIKVGGAAKINGAFVVFSAGGTSSRLENLWISFCEISKIRRSHDLFPMPPRLFATFVVSMAKRISRKIIGWSG